MSASDSFRNKLIEGSDTAVQDHAFISQLIIIKREPRSIKLEVQY